MLKAVRVMHEYPDNQGCQKHVMLKKLYVMSSCPQREVTSATGNRTGRELCSLFDIVEFGIFLLDFGLVMVLFPQVSCSSFLGAEYFHHRLLEVDDLLFDFTTPTDNRQL